MLVDGDGCIGALSCDRGGSSMVMGLESGLAKEGASLLL
jgi:hypothetical protein